MIIWMAPDRVKRYIAREQTAFGGRKGVKELVAERRELVEYRLVPGKAMLKPT